MLLSRVPLRLGRGHKELSALLLDIVEIVHDHSHAQVDHEKGTHENEQDPQKSDLRLRVPLRCRHRLYSIHRPQHYIHPPLGRRDFDQSCHRRANIVEILVPGHPVGSIRHAPLLHAKRSIQSVRFAEWALAGRLALDPALCAVRGLLIFARIHAEHRVGAALPGAPVHHVLGRGVGGARCAEHFATPHNGILPRHVGGRTRHQPPGSLGLEKWMPSTDCLLLILRTHRRKSLRVVRGRGRHTRRNRRVRHRVPLVGLHARSLADWSVVRGPPIRSGAVLAHARGVLRPARPIEIPRAVGDAQVGLQGLDGRAIQHVG
mmetsp:Transcript_4311/g.9276  ORF Transcript_4311/g.9276 Transcript_4311/m.9276 type:complete len:318 (-) Transcript_4311:377-1330(-)